MGKILSESLITAFFVNIPLVKQKRILEWINLSRKWKGAFRVKGLYPILLMVFIISSTRHVYSSPFEGISVFTFDGLTLNSLSIDVIADTNNSMMMTFYSEFRARGTQPMISIYLYKDGCVPTFLRNAIVVVDVIFRYVPGGETIMEIGIYFNRFLVNPKNYTGEILYQIDFREEVNNVLNYFSTKVSNLTAEDVGFAGRFSIQTEFANSTGIISNTGYLRFPLIFDGNMTDPTLDVTIPEEYNLIIAKLGAEDMIKIFPNRVRESISVIPDQRKRTELYMEWELPEPPEPLPPTPWYDEIPWRYLIPGVSGVFITIIVRDVIGRPALKRLKKTLGRSKSKGQRAPKIVFE